MSQDSRMQSQSRTGWIARGGLFEVNRKLARSSAIEAMAILDGVDRALPRWHVQSELDAAATQFDLAARLAREALK